MTELVTHHEEEHLPTGLDLGLWTKIYGLAARHRATMLRLVFTSMTLAAADAVMTLVPKYVIDDLHAHGAQADLGRWVWMYAGLSVLFCVCVWGFICAAGRIATHVSHDIRQEAFRKLQDLSFSYYDTHPAGWLMARLTSDTNKLSRILAWGTLEIVWGTCFTLGLMTIMFIVEWRLALVVLSVVPPLALVSLYFQRKILASSRKVRRNNSEITSSFNESISGVRTTKTLVRERENLGEFDRLTGTMYNNSVRNALYSALYLPFVIALGATGTGLALWRGGVDVLAGGMTLGSLVLFINCSAQLVFPVQELATMFAELQGARAAAERVVELLETEPDIQDSPAVLARIEQSQHAAGQNPSVAIDGGPAGIETVEFHHVHFAYATGEPVLVDFNLRVERGQTIALVGPTGGGKSTIVNLLCRFYEPTAGEIRLDGTDYRRRSLQWLQSNLGIVLQSPHLFSGTVRENIAYGRLDAGEQDIRRAAELVNAHRFITELEDGYDTQVGEGGGKLSTGQKQLISFARAVLADPQIFVMDEATSSIDTETEQLIQAGLAHVLEGRLSFVIAHRLSTIRKADTILVIDGGRIVEQGTHRQLLARRGRYFELYTNQFSRQREEDVLSGGTDEKPRQ
ncbi:MAG: ABC transporter ATP-binding protein [Phycisphaerae bacterium]